MTTRTDTARGTLTDGERFTRTMPAYTAVTVGPGDEDWAVLDHRGVVLYVGPAILAARFAAYSTP